MTVSRGLPTQVPSNGFNCITTGVLVSCRTRREYGVRIDSHSQNAHTGPTRTQSLTNQSALVVSLQIRLNMADLGNELLHQIVGILEQKSILPGIGGVGPSSKTGYGVTYLASKRE